MKNFTSNVLFAVRVSLSFVKLMLGIKNTTQFRKLGSKAVKLWRRGGFKAIRTKLSEEAIHRYYHRDQYSGWVLLFDTMSAKDRRQIHERMTAMPAKPLISILMPVYNSTELYLRNAIESVRKQLYPNWELCIADDHSTKPHIRTLLEKYQQLDPRIKVTYRDQNGHISAASNSALKLANGEFVALLDHDDELSEHALYLVAEEIGKHPDADLIYSDEDKIDKSGRRYDPYFKSDWNLDLFHSHNMVSHLGVYRTSAVIEAGGFREGFEGSQDYDLALRVIERTTESKIHHIPHILYHWRSIRGSLASEVDEKDYASANGRKALEAHFKRIGTDANVLPTIAGFHRVVYPVLEPHPQVSLIVCTRDHCKLLREVVDGILYKTDYANLELIIVDNQSVEQETLDYLSELQKDARVRILKYDASFNFSAMNNLAVKVAQGEIVVLINNDMQMIHADWLREMVSHAIRPRVGVVGAMLYYPNETIQHAGVILGLGGVAGHAHKGFVRTAYGYSGRAQLTQNFSAVTAACMAVRKSIYQEAGGLDEENLRVAFNDIDFCLKVRAKGYLNVWSPYAELYHLESASRKSDSAPEHVERFQREIGFMKNKWRAVIDHDPYYNPNLTVMKEDFSLAFPPRAQRPWQH